MSALNFEAFFEACHGFKPLPWQSRLAAQLCETHIWPDLIDLPTASGKTACMDVALFHLAFCAELGKPQLAARRIVFVVDRRIIVDAAAERADKLVRLLADASATQAIRNVALALQNCGGAKVLSAFKLRGGMPKERGFATCTVQPMLISSTVDQIGSRLLFRGYGVKDYSLSLHAGLLGHDTLILLDEAHLSLAFAETLNALNREQARAQQVLPLKPTRIVPLSATANTSGSRFQLDAMDLVHPLIAQRQGVAKIAELVPCEKAKERPKKLVELATRMLDSLSKQHAAPVVAIVVNRVHLAREIFDLLTTALKGKAGTELLIGRARAIERDVIATRLTARCGAGRKAQNTDQALIVVATQTIEVGADLDFQGLITECAALDSLRQRFGRLDRLGLFQFSYAAIVGGGEAPDDPVYGVALTNTWAWLLGIAKQNSVDFGIQAMAEQLAAPANAATLPTLLAPSREQLQLTPAFMALLCQTAPKPMYDPDVAALLHGFSDAQADVQILWRAHLPLNENGMPDADESKLVNQIMDAVRPSSLETLALSPRAARAWLRGMDSQAHVSDLEGVDIEVEVKRNALKTERSIWRKANEGWEVVKPEKIRPGDTLLVPCEYLGCDAFGFAPDQTSGETADLSDACMQAMAASRQRVRLLTRRAAQELVDIASIMEELKAESLSPKQAARYLKNLLREAGESGISKVELAFRKNGSLFALLLYYAGPKSDDLSEEDDSSNCLPAPVLLASHNAGVGQRAETLARAANLDAALIADLQRSGALHDLGKADPRFQRMLRGDVDTELASDVLLAKGLAKGYGSARPEMGARHETYSVAVLQKYPELLVGAYDPELVLYLIGTHHGRGRGLMPDVPDTGCRFSVPHLEDRYSYAGSPNLGALSADWPDLFWRLNQRYGALGLAYLEAVLRLADHQQSASEAKVSEVKASEVKASEASTYQQGDNHVR